MTLWQPSRRSLIGGASALVASASLLSVAGAWPRHGASWNVVGQQFPSKRYVGTLGADTTFHQTFAIEKAARRIRFKLFNSNASPMVVTGGAIAVSNQLGTGSQQYTPSTGVWVPATWSGASGVTVAAQLMGSVNVPSVVWSDWISLSTVARTDGGTLPVVMIRVTIAAGPYCEGQYATNVMWQQPSGLNNGRFIYTFKDAGSYSTSNQSSFPGDAINAGFPLAVEYEVQGPVNNFIFHGDSITEGAVNGTLGNYGNGWVWQTMSAIRAAYPSITFGCINCGENGTNTNTFLYRMQNYIADGSVRGVFVYSAASPNVGWANQTAVDNQMGWLASAVSAAAAISAPFRTWTPMPGNTQTVTSDGYRLENRADILSTYPSISLDVDPTMADGGTPNKYKSTLSTDGVHPNDAGAAAMTGIAQPWLQAAMY